MNYTVIFRFILVQISIFYGVEILLQAFAPYVSKIFELIYGGIIIISYFTP